MLFFVNAVCASQVPAPATQGDAKREFNDALAAAFDALRDGQPKQAYEIASQLEAICSNHTSIQKHQACSQGSLKKIQGDFHYELAIHNHFELAKTGEYHKAAQLIEELEPHCVFLAQTACAKEHEELLNGAKYMAIRQKVHELVNAKKYSEASIEQRKAEPYARALPERVPINFHWDLAEVLAYFDPKAAADEVRNLVSAGIFRPSRPFANYLSYLGWLASANESAELAQELVRFFEICRQHGGFVNALAPEGSEQEALEALDLLLRQLSGIDRDVGEVSQALLSAIDLAEGKAQPILLRRTGDFVALKAGEHRLAVELYRSSGLNDSEAERRLELAKSGFEEIGDGSFASLPEPSLRRALNKFMEATLSGKESADALMELGVKWDSQTSEEIESEPGEYVMATALLANAAPDDEYKIRILSQAYLKIEARLSELWEKYRDEDLQWDSALNVELTEYVVLLDLARLRSDSLRLHDKGLEHAKEQLRVREFLYGQNSYQLMPSLSSAASAYASLDDQAAYAANFLRAKSVEAHNLSSSGQCNSPPLRFSYSIDYARNALSRSKIEHWFAAESAIHLENGKKFIGVEAQYQCVDSVRWLIAEYLHLLNDQKPNFAAVYELAQIANTSDLLISSELGLEKLRANDPEVAEMLMSYGQLSQDINSSGTHGGQERTLETFLKYKQKKEEIYSRVRLKAPDSASLMIARALSVAETQSTLAEDEALLLYIEIPSIGDGRDAVWKRVSSESYRLLIVKRNDSYFVPIASKRAQDLGAELRRIRGTLDQKVDRASQLEPYDLVAASEVFRTLVKPAFPFLENTKKLFITPSPSLAGIPFELLPTNDDMPSVKSFIDFRKYRDITWMNDRFSISYLSSPRMLSRRKDAESVQDDAFLGLGNPDFPPPSSSAPSVAEGNDATTPSITLQRLLEIDFKALTAAGSDALTLPESQLIVDSMARSYGKRATILAGELATESQLSNLDLSRYSTIVFATHGLLETGTSSEPALALGRENVASEYDGLLTTREIVRMNLAAKLVVLAACNSATKERVRGLLSLASSFLTAGAASVIASHWSVDVNATARLFDAFAKRRQLAPDSLSSDLLRISRIEVLRHSKNQMFAHPVFWGGFSSYGF